LSPVLKKPCSTNISYIQGSIYSTANVCHEYVLIRLRKSEVQNKKMAYAYLVKMYTIFLIEKAKKINYTLPANALF